MKFKWVVEFEVDEVWVADGFDITDDRARDMLANHLWYTNKNTELKARVLKAPDQNEIERAQGWKAVPNRKDLEEQEVD